MGKPVIPSYQERISHLFRHAEDAFGFRVHKFRLSVSKQAYLHVVNSPAYICRHPFSLQWPEGVCGYIYETPVIIDPNLGGTIIHLSVDDGEAVYTTDLS